LLGVIFGVPETLPPERRRTGGLRATGVTMARLVSDREFMGYACAMGLVFAAMFSYISGSPFVLQTGFGVSPQMFSVIFATNGLGIILAGQVGARLSLRYGETRLFISGLVIAGLGGVVLLVMLLAGAGLVGVLPPLFFVVSSIGIVGATGTSLAMQEQGENAGSAAALIGVPQMLVGAMVAPLVGLGGSHSSTPMGVLITICGLGASLCYWGLVRMRMRRGPAVGQ
jgi:MFS transporter, DHA1 family, multidrug resistance protein